MFGWVSAGKRLMSGCRWQVESSNLSPCAETARKLLITNKLRESFSIIGIVLYPCQLAGLINILIDVTAADM